MIFPLSIIISIFYCIGKNKKSITRFFYNLTIFFAVFLFSSKDPFFGIPLYFYFMIISIFCGCFLYGRTVNTSHIFVFLLIVIVMFIQIMNLAFGINVKQAILINVGDTNVMDITSEEALPTLNFTVIKHAVFFIAYLFYVEINRKFIRDECEIKFTISILYKAFKVLILCFICEGIIVNLLGGINDRQLMSFIFNFSANQTENWKTWGLYSVAFCFTERSYLNCIIIYYIILLKKRFLTNSDFLFFLLSYVAILFSGSSAALSIGLVFFVLFIARIFVSKDINNIIKLFALIVSIVGLFIILKFSGVIFEKIGNFFSYNEEWGSAYFRRNSISFGLQAFYFSPFIGLGIGTVYCHSMIVQVLANIGLLGFIGTIYYHVMIINRNISIKSGLLLFIVFVISCFTFMIQEFTSPFLLGLLLVCLSDGKRAKYKNKQNIENAQFNFTGRDICRS